MNLYVIFIVKEELDLSKLRFEVGDEKQVCKFIQYCVSWAEKSFKILFFSKTWFKKHPKTKINFTIFVFNTIYTAFKTTFTQFLKPSSYHFIMNSWLCTTYLLKETILTNKMHLEGLISILATYFSSRTGVHADSQCRFEEVTAMTTNHFSFSQIICWYVLNFCVSTGEMKQSLSSTE